MSPRFYRLWVFVLLAAITLAACGSQPAEAKVIRIGTQPTPSSPPALFADGYDPPWHSGDRYFGVDHRLRLQVRLSRLVPLGVKEDVGNAACGEYLEGV